MNLSARYGWRCDLFVSVLSDADASGAEGFVQRVRTGMAAVAAALPMPALSVGIAEMDSDIASPEEFVERAELARAEARARAAIAPGCDARTVPTPGTPGCSRAEPAAARGRSPTGTKEKGAARLRESLLCIPVRDR